MDVAFYFYETDEVRLTGTLRETGTTEAAMGTRRGRDMVPRPLSGAYPTREAYESGLLLTRRSALSVLPETVPGFDFTAPGLQEMAGFGEE